LKPSKKTIFRFPDNKKSTPDLKRVDVNPTTTDKKGLAGIYELLLRRFKTTVYLGTLMPLYILGGAMLGVSIAPGIALFEWVQGQTETIHPVYKYLALGSTVGAAIFITGFSLMILAPTLNFLLRTTPKPYRGPYYSVDFVKWFIHNSLLYLVRYTFLEFVTPTPFNLAFYRAMGMKVGKGTQINTSNISDPALIELGDYVTVGGSATIVGHYGQGGYLVLAPVKIGDKVTIGLRASIMGGVNIGEGAKILPHSIVLPKTQIPAGETWGGVPAVKLEI
jgi:hypothetical protein